MDLSTLTANNPAMFKPWKFEGTAMAPNVLVICKLLILLMLAYHFYGMLVDPFIPFLKPLDYFNQYPGVFELLMKTSFTFFAVALFLNIKVRTACIALGIIVILQQLGTKPGFKNHIFVCGCVFLLAGLTNKKDGYWLLVWQLIIIYFGAFINKILDPDWHDGAFMHNWLFNARKNGPYIYLSGILPDNWLALFLSWSAMLSELIIGILLLFKKYRKHTFWLIVVFHTILYSVTGIRFGHFYDDLMIILLVFVSWPYGTITIELKDKLNLGKQIHHLIDWDKKFQWKPLSESAEKWMTLTTKDGEHYTNMNAIRKLLIYTPSFPVLLFTLDCAIKFIFDDQNTVKHMIYMPLIWSTILFFIPLLWTKSSKSEAI
jgi:hypothetical protein